MKYSKLDMVTHSGEMKKVIEWLDQLGINYSTYTSRRRSGKSSHMSIFGYENGQEFVAPISGYSHYSTGVIYVMWMKNDMLVKIGFSTDETVRRRLYSIQSEYDYPIQVIAKFANKTLSDETSFHDYFEDDWVYGELFKDTIIDDIYNIPGCIRIENMFGVVRTKEEPYTGAASISEISELDFEVIHSDLHYIRRGELLARRKGMYNKLYKKTESEAFEANTANSIGITTKQVREEIYIAKHLTNGSKEKILGSYVTKTEAMKIARMSAEQQMEYLDGITLDLPRLVVDLRGIKIGRLTVVGFHGIINGKTYWDVVCDCSPDIIRTIWGGSISGNKKNKTQSCGCHLKEIRGNATRTHGMSNHPLYYVWKGMIARCHNQNDPGFENYGSRGISVCNRWRESVTDFIDDVMPLGFEQGLTLDRINNDGNYEITNVRWATKEQQARNTRRNIRIAYNGITQTLTEWCDMLGLCTSTVTNRMTRWGISYNMALFGCEAEEEWGETA